MPVHSQARTGRDRGRLYLSVLLAVPGLLYPALVPVLYQAAAQRWNTATWLAALAASFLAVLSVPALGAWLLLASAGTADAGSLRLRLAGLLLLLSPGLLVLTRVLLQILGQSSASWTCWFAAWAILFPAAVSLGARAELRLSAKVITRSRRLHLWSGLAILVFALAHLGNNLIAVHDLDAYNRMASLLRTVYRTQFAEPVLLAAIGLQILSGLMLGANGLMRRASSAYVVQIATGFYLAAFLSAHTLAVVFMGRQILDRGPDFTFASGGPSGLLASRAGVALAPYYFLAVIAFFGHLSEPCRRMFIRGGSTSPAALWPRILIVCGVVVGIVLLIALCAPGGSA